MRIVPSPSGITWRVVALWYNDEPSTLFSGDLYECLHWVKEQTGKSYAEGTTTDDI